MQEQSNDLTNLTENYGHASHIYEKLGDFPSALIYERKARAMKSIRAAEELDRANVALEKEAASKSRR